MTPDSEENKIGFCMLDLLNVGVHIGYNIIYKASKIELSFEVETATRSENI